MVVLYPKSAMLSSASGVNCGFCGTNRCVKFLRRYQDQKRAGSTFALGVITAVWLFESDTFMGCNKDLIVFCDIDKILLVTKKQLMLGFATISGIAFLETHAAQC
ncbi:hypothetical protein SAMN02745132_04130 [Enterovibrio nigricans DSM 22720]|uniref:Uncharacterized protein n=1 Tax=Enterovibrio nigricans DSM 22720 TaxID=1121868 RepID=A0A1T4VQA2_9GAMM|nr:hypothetical protein SAMN02745132_04130 [Enterovibrio nigricans DSM 22720]